MISKLSSILASTGAGTVHLAIVRDKSNYELSYRLRRALDTASDDALGASIKTNSFGAS